MCKPSCKCKTKSGKISMSDGNQDKKQQINDDNKNNCDV